MSDSSDFDPEEFFLECLELGICAQCCKNSENVFLFPPNCDHRLCLDCCLALPLDLDVLECPTCKRPFEVDLLTPDYSFKGLWEGFTKELNRDVFDRLVKESESKAIAAKSLRENLNEAKSEKKKQRRPDSTPAKQCAASSFDSNEAKSEKKKQRRPDSTPAKQCAASSFDSNEAKSEKKKQRRPDSTPAKQCAASSFDSNEAKSEKKKQRRPDSTPAKQCAASSFDSNEAKSEKKKQRRPDSTPAKQCAASSFDSNEAKSEKKKQRRPDSTPAKQCAASSFDSKIQQMPLPSYEYSDASPCCIINNKLYRDTELATSKLSKLDIRSRKCATSSSNLGGLEPSKLKKIDEPPTTLTKKGYAACSSKSKEIKSEQSKNDETTDESPREKHAESPEFRGFETAEDDDQPAEKVGEASKPIKQKRRRGRPPGPFKIKKSAQVPEEEAAKKPEARRGSSHAKASMSTSSDEGPDEPKGQPSRDNGHAISDMPPPSGKVHSAHLEPITPRARNLGSSTPSSSSSVTRSPSVMLKRNSKLETPLHEYCSLGCRNKSAFKLEKLQEMLEAGGNPNTLDGSGISPLHESIICDRLDIMTLLLKCGALVNCYRSDPLWTPLHEAVNKYVKYGITNLSEQSIPYKVITFLLDCGADLHLKDEFRRTPRDLAVDNPAIVNLLEAYQPQSIARVRMLAPEPPMVVLFCTDDSKALKKFGNRFKVKCLPEQCGFKPEVTHLVFKSGPKEANHVLRLAILNGCYVVTTQWVRDCLERDALLPEAAYEIPGPLVPNSNQGYVTRRARIDRLNMKPKLFTGGRFHVPSGATDGIDKQLRGQLLDLIEAGGGKVLHRMPKDHSFGEDLPKLYHASQESKWKDCSILCLYARPPTCMFRMNHMRHQPVTWFVDCVDTYCIREE